MSELLCIVCPMGCWLTVTQAEDGTYRVRGAQCKRGIEYGQREASAPTRVLTTTLTTAWGRPLPVHSAAPIDRALLLDAQKRLAGVIVEHPVAAGEILLADIDGQGTPLVAGATAGPNPK